MGCTLISIFIVYGNPNKIHKPVKPLGMDVSFILQYPMGMGIGMSTIFLNGYECWYDLTLIVPAPLPSLSTKKIGIPRD